MKPKKTGIFKCERIIKMRYNRNLKRIEYQLKWLGYPASMNTWEPRENILDKNLIKLYKKRIYNSRHNIPLSDQLVFSDKDLFDSENDLNEETTIYNRRKKNQILKEIDKSKIKQESDYENDMEFQIIDLYCAKENEFIILVKNKNLCFQTLDYNLVKEKYKENLFNFFEKKIFDDFEKKK